MHNIFFFTWTFFASKNGFCSIFSIFFYISSLLSEFKSDINSAFFSLVIPFSYVSKKIKQKLFDKKKIQILKQKIFN